MSGYNLDSSPGIGRRCTIEWVRVPTIGIDEPSRAALPDFLWRLLYEIDLLCGVADGPIPYDPAGIAWRLHKADAQAVTQGMEELTGLGLLVVGDGRVCPVNWIELNAPYLHKLQYNRNRRRAQSGKGNEDMLTLEEQQKVRELERFEADLRRSGKSEYEVAQLSLRKMVELGVTMGQIFEAMPTGREGKGSVSQAPLDPGAPWRVWAKGNTVVYQLPGEQQEASYLLFTLAGFEPSGSKKEWASAVQELVEAAGHNMGVLRQAIEEGQRARVRSHLTFRGPRSFISYARDLRSRANLDRRSVADDLAGGDDKQSVDISL